MTDKERELADYDYYTRKLRDTNNEVRDLNGELVMDLATGKPLIKFRDAKLISIDMRDPDFALKQLEKLNKGKYAITCSKCHHCR